MSATVSAADTNQPFDPSVWSDRLSGGATITLRAAARHAGRTGALHIAPSHILLALLERPERRVRAFLEERGASVAWLCDTLHGGIEFATSAPAAAVDTIIDAAHREATTEGQSRVDDYRLFLTVLKHADVLSHNVLREAGVIGQLPSVLEVPAEIEQGIAALVAQPGAFAPRIGVRRPDERRSVPMWRLHARALAYAIDVSPLFTLILGVLVGTAIMLAMRPPERFERPLIAAFIVSVWLASLCLHEFGHAAVAYWFGDSNARRAGYLTLDIRKYSHPLITIALPMLGLLGGGIPLPGGAVYISPDATSTPRRNRLISAAGPAANVICLAMLAIPLWLGIDQWTPLGFALAGAASIQAGAIVFNLLPIPPFDGWHIASAGCSASVRYQTAALGFMPMIAVTLLFRSVPELAAAFWSIVDIVSALAHAGEGPAAWGRYMLRLN